MTTSKPDAIEIWFPIEKDEDGYPQSQDWEQLWSWPTEGGYRIDNIPFFSAVKTDKGWYCFDALGAGTLHTDVGWLTSWPTNHRTS